MKQLPKTVASREIEIKNATEASETLFVFRARIRAFGNPEALFFVTDDP